MNFSKLYVWKITLFSMNINTVFTITEKMQQSLRYFILNFLFKFKYPLWHHKILHCVIKNYLKWHQVFHISIISQCARGKSSIARKPEDHLLIIKW